MQQRRPPGLTPLVIDLFASGWVLARVAFFTAASLAVFLLAFLGYFTLPFVFVLIAVALLGMSGSLRQLARLRAAVRRWSGR
jgi:hypothetical protein